MKLKNIMEQENILLSSTQKKIILTIYISITPLLAFEEIQDSETDIIAVDLLNRYGYINIYENGAELTSKGQEALVSYGLVDENGEVTDMGQKILDNYE